MKVKHKEVEPALIFKEVEIMVADLSNTTPKKSAWFERKQKLMMDSDA